MKSHFSLHWLLPVVALTLGASVPEAAAKDSKILRVSAAASLADALKKVNPTFEKEVGVKVELNLGASSTLARQIEEGAPVDIFFSADTAKMDALEKKGLVQKETREDQLSNTLALIVPVDSTLKIESVQDLVGDKINRIATGDPKAVPVGVYAREWLTEQGLWEKIEPKIVSTENVRAALAAVESGNIDVGIVYKTDALISSKVKIALDVPAEKGPAITYPMAALSESKEQGLAQKYLDFLDTEAVQKVFSELGFTVLPE